MLTLANHNAQNRSVAGTSNSRRHPIQGRVRTGENLQCKKSDRYQRGSLKIEPLPESETRKLYNPKSTPNCTPQALTRKNFLKKPGAGQKDLGITTLYLGQVTYPQVKMIRKGRKWTLAPTKAVLPAITSFYTGKSSYFQGKRIAVNFPNCTKSKLPVQWRITSSGAAKIAEGEQEHCNDFHFAFNYSLARYAAEVNRLAGKKTYWKKRSFLRLLKKNTGVAPNQWRNKFIGLTQKTQIRDTKKWHEPVIKHQMVRGKTDCKYFRITVDSGSFKHIGKYPPSSIIK